MNRYDALSHAVKAHGSALDKCGQLYMFHPIAVAVAIERTWDDVKGVNSWGMLPGGIGCASAAVVALVHDVLEDTDYELDAGDFTRSQWDALYALTRKPGEEYYEYIRFIIATGPLAILVKLADLWHNLQPERQDCLEEGERRELEKRYLKTRQMLWDALGYEWWPS